MVPLFHSSAFYRVRVRVGVGVCGCRTAVGVVPVICFAPQGRGPTCWIARCPVMLRCPHFPVQLKDVWDSAAVPEEFSFHRFSCFVLVCSCIVCVCFRKAPILNDQHDLHNDCGLTSCSEQCLPACDIQWVWVCDPNVVFIERAVLRVACRVVAVPRALPFRLQATTGSFRRPWDRMAIPWTASSCPGTRCTSAARSLCAPWP